MIIGIFILPLTTNLTDVCDVGFAFVPPTVLLFFLNVHLLYIVMILIYNHVPSISLTLVVASSVASAEAS